MRRKKNLVAAAILSTMVGVGAHSLFAQTTPEGALSGPANPTQPMPNAQQPGPTFPQPGLTIPQQGQRTMPTEPAPGLPQSKPIPGQPTPGSPQTEIPGQTAPLPGQPGTIPERLEQPSAPSRLDAPGTSTQQQSPGTAARLEGERRSIIPPEPRSTVPQPGQSGTLQGGSGTTPAPSSSPR